jgi:hypothetical protein
MSQRQTRMRDSALGPSLPPIAGGPAFGCRAPARKTALSPKPPTQGVHAGARATFKNIFSLKSNTTWLRYGKFLEGDVT